MKFPQLHSWDLDYASARALQSELADRVDSSPQVKTWKTVAAADISYNLRSPQLHAALVVADAATGAIIERVGLTAEARFPYIPGLLSFRELPSVLQAFRLLKNRPDVVLCDGQGYAHPRRMGLACHLGLWLGIPTIGCAKSRLIGGFVAPGLQRGDRSPLVDKEETIGAVVRTRNRVQPLFISTGHLCDLESAVTIVLASVTKYRQPDVSRATHNHVNELRRRAGRPAVEGLGLSR